MKKIIHNYLWCLFILGHNVNIRGFCPITKPQCPIGYELKSGWCHYVGPEIACPPDYENRNGLCYLQEDCFMPDMTTTPSAIIVTSTNNGNKGSEQDRCPQDAIFMNEKCHKIICSLGEYYNGRCLQSACPPGLVWFGKRCQKPAYSITILEIDNNIINEKRNHPYTIIQNTTNLLRHDVINETTASSTSTLEAAAAAATTRSILKDSTSMSDNGKMLSFTKSTRPTTTTTTTTTPITRAPPTTVKATLDRSHMHNNENVTDNYTKNCCVIVTPRICKMYGMKWVCFNRRQFLCDTRICVAPTIYLKAPAINYKYPLLIMPPNPTLKSCSQFNCTSNDTNVESDIEVNTKIDCSGCINGQRQHCSSYCYHYICPQGACIYMKLEEYCNYYSKQFGCLEQDGCIWSWC